MIRKVLLLLLCTLNLQNLFAFDYFKDYIECGKNVVVNIVNTLAEDNVAYDESEKVNVIALAAGIIGVAKYVAQVFYQDDDNIPEYTKIIFKEAIISTGAYYVGNFISSKDPSSVIGALFQKTSSTYLLYGCAPRCLWLLMYYNMRMIGVL